MWKDISSFELRYQTRQPLLALSSAVFFCLALALASSDVGTAVGNAPGTTLRNAPIVILRLMPILSLLSLFVITAFFAGSALRDDDGRSAMIFFTKPLSKLDYLGGRFLGSMAVSSVVLLASVAGLALAAFMPWQPSGRLGSFGLGPYLFGLMVIILPNLVFMGCLFFALAISSRRLTLTYLCVVFFIGMQDVIEVVAQNLDSRVLGSLLEPSGIVALETVSRYWTLAEQNGRMPELGGILLANRLVWLAIGFAALAWSIHRFDFTTREGKRSKKWLAKSSSAGVGQDVDGSPQTTAELPEVSRRVGHGASWGNLLRQAKIEVSEVVVGAPFLTLLAFGLMFVVAYSLTAGRDEGVFSYPLTHLMLQGIQMAVRLTLVMILVIYGGELIFNQRTLKLSQVYDALPVSNGTFLGAKVLAMVGIVGAFLAAAATTTVVVQLGRGFSNLEPGLYLRGLAVIALPVVLLAALILFLQVVANHKWSGLLLTVLALVVTFALPRLGFENNLYLYGKHSPIAYSDLNGYGHQTKPFLWFMAYWGCAAWILLLAALLFWPRGTEGSFRERLTVARRRLSPWMLSSLLLGLVGMAAIGGWIYFNGHVLHGYYDRDRIVQDLADYERYYGAYGGLPLPRITSVFAEVDVFPTTRRAQIRGRYRLENRGDVPIRTLPVSRSSRWEEGVLRVYGGVTLRALDLPPHRVVVHDDDLGFYVFELDRPLEVGESFDMEFTVEVDHGGFMNNRHNYVIVDNGTFFSDRNVFPHIGYADSKRLLRPDDRQRHGLPQLERAADLDDAAAAQRNYLDGDWVDFEAVISTDAEQIAIAPGDLVNEWTEGRRRFFHYKAKEPITHLIPFLSGRYEVARERWQGVDIEIYFHPDHAFNIDRFMATTKTSLAYMTEHFGPYPHGQLRIVETPNYDGRIAFAFAQTIPYSEAWGFTADLDGAELDWLTAILAHEVSHQWWNHQLVPADVQGATLIGETLAQYSAMMILEDMYGAEKVRHFLKFHLDRYLQGRGNETLQEMPLAQVENQAYIHYSKGSLALYALKDWVGEEAINGALRRFLEGYAFQGPPYATARDLLAHLRDVTPQELKHVIGDLFESITLFDHRVVVADVQAQQDGTFVVDLTTDSRKLRDDGHGSTSTVAIDDWVDFGVFGEETVDGEVRETVLVLEKRHLREDRNTFRWVVDQRPVRVGIDPYNKLIDRNSEDNVRRLSHSSRP